MSHAGSDKMLNLIQLKYTWANMAADVQEFSKGCGVVNTTKNHSLMIANDICKNYKVLSSCKYITSMVFLNFFLKIKLY
jgi:hypothetical protein